MGRRTFVAEDLYKLNEAVFNLPEEDTVDTKTTARLQQAVQKIVNAYVRGGYDQSDPNFFYDYVALLSTMQNQHFFNEKQNKQMLAWLLEAVGGEADLPKAKAPSRKEAAESAAQTKEIEKMEKENAKLARDLAKLRELSDAVLTLKTFKPPQAETKDGGKAKGKSKGGNANEEAKGKSKGKREDK